MRSATPIDPQLRQKVRRELEPDESPRWVGTPVPRFFSGHSVAAFLFGIPWTAFALFWTFGAAGFRIPDLSKGLSAFDLFPLFGLPFIAVGIGLLATPLWKYWKATKTVYVITDRRAISIEGGWTTTVRSFTPSELENTYRKDRRDGTGDVLFTNVQFRHGRRSDGKEPLGFLSVRNPRDVERMLSKLAEEDSKGHDW